MDVDKQIAALQADLNAAHHITYLTEIGRASCRERV